MTPLSDKHIDPCPCCRRPSWDCEGHTPEEWSAHARAVQGEGEPVVMGVDAGDPAGDPGIFMFRDWRGTWHTFPVMRRGFTFTTKDMP